MPNGFSTPIWGPPLWRILHTLGAQLSRHHISATQLAATPNTNTAHTSIVSRGKRHKRNTPLVSATVAHTISTWLHTLATILPCYFCRDSYAEFLKMMQNTHGPVVDVITRGQLSKWMYDMHELVNDKLDKQHATKTLMPMLGKMCSAASAVPITPVQLEMALAHNDAYRGRRITFECVQKRYVITPISFSTQDVWDVLSIFALNYPTRPDENPHSIQKAHDFLVFISLSPTVLRECGMHKLANHIDTVPFTDDDVASTTAMFKWVTRLQTPHVLNSDIPQIYARYNLAQAGSCLHGACI